MNKIKLRLPKIKIPISLQISIFLIIIAFIPVVVMMALKTYEKQQLDMLESSNVQQGRIVAAALSVFDGTASDAVSLLENMNGHFTSRIRVLDADGLLLADSARFEKESAVPKSIEKSRYDSSTVEENSKEKIDAQDSFVYRVFSFPIRIYRKLLRRPAISLYDTADFYNGKKIFDGEEVEAALNGRYGAVTRISSGNQVSVTLYSAVPVKDKSGTVTGAVLVSRSTYRILRNLYELRRDLALVYLKSLVAVLLIGIFFAFRISHPLKKLSDQATECADKKGRIIFTKFTGNKRLDEIGELSRSFTSLIERLNKRIQFSQAFSSDISHEFKNPLTAIRASAELLSDPELADEDRKELTMAVVSEVNHLQMLLTGVRNISKIDAGEELYFEPIPAASFVKNVVERVERKYSKEKEISIKVYDEILENYMVKIPEDYFDRVAENLIDNGASFGSIVEVRLKSDSENNFILTVEDNGKGINEDALSKIFNRFYSEREESQKQNHTGLGLSTVKAIADAMEGEITAGTSETLGGAKFSIKFPQGK